MKIKLNIDTEELQKQIAYAIKNGINDGINDTSVKTETTQTSNNNAQTSNNDNLKDDISNNINFDPILNLVKNSGFHNIYKVIKTLDRIANIMEYSSADTSEKFQDFKQSLVELNQALVEFGESIKDLGSYILDNFGKLNRYLKDFGSKIITKLHTNFTNLGSKIISKFIGKFADINKKINDVFTINNFKKIFKKDTPDKRFQFSSVGLFTKSFRQFKDALFGKKDIETGKILENGAISQFGSAAKELLNMGIKKTPILKGMDMSAIAKPFKGALGEAKKDLFAGIGKIPITKGMNISDIAKPFKDALGEAKSQTSKEVARIYPEVKKTLGGIPGMILPALGEAKSQAIKELSRIYPEVKKTLGEIKGIFGRAIADFGNKIINKIKNITGNIITGINNKISSIIKPILDSKVGQFAKRGMAGLSNIGNKLGTFTSGLSGKLGNVIGKGGKVLGAAGGAAGAALGAVGAAMPMILGAAGAILAIVDQFSQFSGAFKAAKKLVEVFFNVIFKPIADAIGMIVIPVFRFLLMLVLPLLKNWNTSLKMLKDMDVPMILRPFIAPIFTIVLTIMDIIDIFLNKIFGMNVDLKDWWKDTLMESVSRLKEVMDKLWDFIEDPSWETFGALQISSEDYYKWMKDQAIEATAAFIKGVWDIGIMIYKFILDSAEWFDDLIINYIRDYLIDIINDVTFYIKIIIIATAEIIKSFISFFTPPLIDLYNLSIEILHSIFDYIVIKTGEILVLISRFAAEASVRLAKSADIPIIGPLVSAISDAFGMVSGGLDIKTINDNVSKFLIVANKSAEDLSLNSDEVTEGLLSDVDKTKTDLLSSVNEANIKSVAAVNEFADKSIDLIELSKDLQLETLEKWRDDSLAIFRSWTSSRSSSRSSGGTGGTYKWIDDEGHDPDATWVDGGWLDTGSWGDDDWSDGGDSSAGPISSFQVGGEVPETNNYTLHGGELVIPRWRVVDALAKMGDDVNSGSNVSINIDMTVNNNGQISNDMDMNDLAERIKEKLMDDLRMRGIF